jgi:hypothetical protein
MSGLDDFCAACEQPLGETHHAEHLATPIGRCYVRVHPVAACTDRARTMLGGHPVDPGPTREERNTAKLKAPVAGQGELPKATGAPDPTGFWAAIGGEEWAKREEGKA